jgi:hypothetical protein
MHTPTIRTRDFIAQLQPHVDKQIAFEYDGRRIQPGYHVTEIKAASFRSLDCGARPQQWEETIVQLWDVADKPEQGHMSVRRFLGIYGKVDRDVNLNGDAEIKFEWGDADTPAVFYTLNSMCEEGDTLVASLEPVRATCKPRDEWWLAERGVSVSASANASSCCAPSTANGMVSLADIAADGAPVPAMNPAAGMPCCN